MFFGLEVVCHFNLGGHCSSGSCQIKVSQQRFGFFFVVVSMTFVYAYAQAYVCVCQCVSVSVCQL